jgi:hypothetical protein
MKVGFTGTRHGGTPQQKETLSLLLVTLKPTEAHHGDCVGADAEFHHYVRIVCGRAVIIVHPPLHDDLRAWCILDEFTRMRPEKPYLARNLDIVDETDVLIAMPAEATEQLRGGTWYTIRYARRQHKKVYMILPDGTLQEN